MGPFAAMAAACRTRDGIAAAPAVRPRPPTIRPVEIAGPVLDVVLPVYGLIATGWAAARAGRLRAEDVRRFSDLTFVVFVPALLFRAMARADFGALAPGVPLAYFAAALAMFGAVVALRWRRGARVDAAVDGLAASFSNTVMIGIPLARIGWGEPGLALLLSIVAFHSLVMLTSATFVFEVAAATGHPARAAGVALRRSLTHPVILPIVAGALWGAFGLPLPGPVDATIGLLAAVPGAAGRLARRRPGARVPAAGARAHRAQAGRPPAVGLGDRAMGARARSPALEHRRAGRRAPDRRQRVPVRAALPGRHDRDRRGRGLVDGPRRAAAGGPAAPPAGAPKVESAR